MDFDEQLDDLLNRAAAPVSERTAELRRELDLLVEATAPTARRRTVRAFGVAGAVAAGMGLTTVAASAAGLLPGWTLLNTESGQTCQVRVAADAHDGDAHDGQFTASERATTLAAARSFLDSFDYSSVDHAQAIAHWQAEEDAAIQGQPDPSERQPRLEGDDLEVTAVSYEVTQRLEDHLTAEGLDIEAVAISWQATGCQL
ncbi:hypothetical protein GCM10022215_21110 [Nocardioides fonticola]|uniref:Uncharacterized protein n=1 Tax=Nocardioides fonticola TaxID=450363 RepID=A0ABP7XJ47_9ACTN